MKLNYLNLVKHIGIRNWAFALICLWTWDTIKFAQELKLTFCEVSVVSKVKKTWRILIQK